LRSAHSQAAPKTSYAPTKIAERYQVEAALGRGGTAQLYRVLDAASGRTLALKQLRAGDKPKLRELFELEYQTLASLEHPRTPRVYEFGNDSLGPFYTMELLEGGDLSGSTALPWRTVCSYLRDASQALGVLHARRLIHRDVSPRNLWREPNGRLKLIDFGALAPFGPNTQVIGTPPLVPPEALASRALDQRADLYALGGVAYYLLTGSHAFPARYLDELPDLWRKSPLAPSARMAQLKRDDLESLPPELDQLVLALLSGDPLVRPYSTAEVIDRIDAICGPTPESEREAAQLRLTNLAFVGRPRERRTLAKLLDQAARSTGQVCILESAPGGGRSRLLKELELTARVSHAIVLHVNAAAEPGMFGAANALAMGLLDAVPERARSAAEPYAPLLAHLSPRMRDRLGVAAAPHSEIPGELRVRIQEAQRDWFLAVARERPVVLLVDDLEYADDASAAFLLALGLGLADSKLLLVGAVVRDRARERSAAIRALVRLAHSMVLPPLKAAELSSVLQSVFGQAEHLSRLAGRLFELTHGNPGHALELCRQLVDRNLITFESGHWLLPRELDVTTLSASREQALTERLSRLGGPARELARTLSVHSGPLSPRLCRALAESAEADLLRYLGELIDAEILVPSGENLLFAYEQFRKTCASELAPEALKRARSALAEQLIATPDAGLLERLYAGVHWTAAGDPRGLGMVVREARELLFHDVDKLGPAVAGLEEALAAFQAQGRPEVEQVTILTALTLAGYEGDRKYVLKYGETTVRALERVLGLTQVRARSRILGRKLALGSAIGAAAARLTLQRNNPCVPKVFDALLMLFTAVAASAGMHAICFDPDAAARFAQVLEPFAALGKRNPGAMMYDFCKAVVASSRDCPYATRATWKRLLGEIANTESSGISEQQLRRVRGGALFGMAALETLLDGDDAIHAADQLDENGLQLDHMYADQVRTIFHGVRGNIAAYEHFRQRAEHHAIARGTSWQVEAWIPGPMSVIAMQLRDALAMKNASEQMRRSGEQIPSCEVHARHMRGNYLLLRGKYAEAVPLLEDCLFEEPGTRSGWGRHLGILAYAYNRLGRHEDALKACQLSIDNHHPNDFEFALLYLVVHTEHAIAQAGLGRLDVARNELAQLRARRAKTSNPLVRGALAETGLEIALLTNDVATAREELVRIEALYRPLSVPSLAQYCESLAARVARLERGPGASVPPPFAASDDSDGLFGSVEDLITRRGLPLPALVQRALRLFAASTQANDGALYVVEPSGTPHLQTTLSGDAPSEIVQRWMTDRLALELEDERTVLQTEADSQQVPWNVLQEGSRTHRIHVLTGPEGVVLALVVLSREGMAPAACPTSLLRTVAERLHEALGDERSGTGSVAANRNSG
jgi:tetratricopeptide (TPR) repeat protein